MKTRPLGPGSDTLNHHGVVVTQREVVIITGGNSDDVRRQERNAGLAVFVASPRDDGAVREPATGYKR
jgi:hypothetical protein